MIPGEIFPASGEIVLNKDRAAIITISLKPMPLSLLIDEPLLGIAWTFRRERRCASNRDSPVKCH
jgi:hypothetical protein